MPTLITIPPGGANINPSMPRQGPTGLQYAGRALSEFGDVMQRVQDAADTAEASMLTQTSAQQIEGWIQQTKDKYGDSTEFNSFASSGVEEIVQKTLDSAKNQRVKSLVQAKLAPNVVNAQNQVRHHTSVLNVANAKANSDIAVDAATQRRKLIVDPIEQATIDSGVFQDLRDLVARGVFTPGEAVAKAKGYRNKVLSDQAEMQIEDAPGTFLTEVNDPNGRYRLMDEAAKSTYRSKARAKINHDDIQRDKIHAQVKAVVMRGWQAMANRGAIPEADLQDALENRNPYITPQDARALSEINESPPTGEGADQVRVLRTMYRLTNGTEADVRNYRARLINLQNELGRPSKLIEQFADELQADLFRAQNTAINRDNVEYQRKERESRALVESFRAVNPPFPSNAPIFTNRNKQVESQIKDAMNRGNKELARKLAEGRAAEIKAQRERQADDLKAMERALGK